jgi:hypothetical protein
MGPHRKRTVARLAAITVGLLTAASAQQSTASLDDDIIRFRKELAQTQLDCQRTGEEIQKDRTDFETYKKRTSDRMSQARRQLDTLASEIKTQARGNDSLAALIASIQADRKQIELAQNEFRRTLIILCNQVLPLTRRLPPLTMAPAQSALSLLISDLSASSIDINEGFSRLTQVIGQLNESTSSIQISQENSPAPDIRGMAYRLRIGSLFEAVVDPKGEKCAFFTGWNTDGSPKWKTITSAATAREILNAVNIREGKMLPAFVTISLTPPADSVVTGGGK